MARKEYATVTFLIEKNQLAKINDEAKQHKRGWKTWFINSAIRAFRWDPGQVNMSKANSRGWRTRAINVAIERFFCEKKNQPG